MQIVDEAMKALKHDLTRLRENAHLGELSIKQQKAVALLGEAERAARIDDKIRMSGKLEVIEFEERQWLIKLSEHIKAPLATEALVMSYQSGESAPTQDPVSIIPFQIS